jgi:hypothetical protein
MAFPENLDASPSPAGREAPPYPESHWVGKRCSFNYETKRLCGTVLKAEYIGRTQRGQLPDYSLQVAGASGKTLTISLVENYASFE